MSSTLTNADRHAKMRTLTLTDGAWKTLTSLAGPGGSRSAVIEAWLLEMATPADAKATSR